MSKTWGFFLVTQDMVLSHRAKFQLIINFFRVKASFTGPRLFGEDLFFCLHLISAKNRFNSIFDEDLFFVGLHSISATKLHNVH